MLKLKIMKMILIIVIKKYNIVTDSNSENNFNGTECHSDNNNDNNNNDNNDNDNNENG